MRPQLPEREGRRLDDSRVLVGESSLEEAGHVPGGECCPPGDLGATATYRRGRVAESRCQELEIAPSEAYEGGKCSRPHCGRLVLEGPADGALVPPPARRHRLCPAARDRCGMLAVQG